MAICQALGTPSNMIFVPSMQPWVPLFRVAQFPVLVLIVWGATLAIRSKGRSLWWLVLLLPFLLNGVVGLVMTAILFGLKDKTVDVRTTNQYTNEPTAQETR